MRAKNLAARCWVTFCGLSYLPWCWLPRYSAFDVQRSMFSTFNFSSNLVNWVSLVTNTPSGSPVLFSNVLDSTGPNFIAWAVCQTPDAALLFHGFGRTKKSWNINQFGDSHLQ
jgi:hypothetical protein